MQHTPGNTHLRRVFISVILIALFTVSTSLTTFAGQEMPKDPKAEFTQFPPIQK